MTPFRSEKNTNWEGAFRVPLIVRWPGKIPAGVGLQRDRPAPRLAADVPGHGRRAGHRREAASRGHKAAGKTFKVHIDGYNLLPYLTGKEAKSPRQGFIYFDDDGDLVAPALRQLEGRLHGAAHAGARCASGRSRSCRCAFPSCSTCAPIRSSGPTSPRTPTTTGSSTTTTLIFAAQGLVASSWRRSRSSRRARRRPASPSTRRWRR